MRLALIGNCQVAPWRETLRALSPDIEVVNATHVGVTDDVDTFLLKVQESAVDCIVVLNELETGRLEAIKASEAAPMLVRVPSITFGAFHPDCTYVTDGTNVIKTFWGTAWTPRLAGWCFVKGISLAETCELYRDDQLFRSLGYFGAAEASCLSMQRSFADCGLSFDKWYWQAKRYGVFMHGINHPRVIAVAFLMEMVLRDQLSIPCLSAESVHGTIEDPLLRSVSWPVHGPVARALGLPAMEVVRVGGRSIRWDDFLEGCFEGWRAEGRNSETLRIDRTLDTETLSDRVVRYREASG